MSEIKFTSDGKKVAVIGKINQSTFIVQEIFVSGENEIPSGEAFTVTSLHDEPVKSWKEKEVEKIERQINDAREKLNIYKRDEEKKYQKAIDALKEKSSYLRKVVNNVTVESFDMITDYLLGNIKFVVLEKWKPELIDFENMDNECSFNKDRFKLISLYGKDDGTLSFRMHEYSDGSGMGSVKFSTHKKKESAIDKMKELISKMGVSSTSIPLAKEYGVILDVDEVEKYKAKRFAEIQKTIDSLDKSKAASISELNDLKSL